MKSYRCSNCGAEILINDDNNFSKCIYCGSTVTLIHKEYKDLNIKKVILFKNPEIDAVNYLTNYLGYTTRESIVDVKRIYIPVRFCSYDFNYLCSYQAEEGSGDDTTLVDRTGLLDGMVYNEAILETNIMNKILGFHDLRDNVRCDFDPVKLGNISCEFSDKYTEENIIKLIEKRMVEFGNKNFSRGTRSITKIYNVNHYLTNTKIDNYTTLVPVYLIRCKGGRNFAVSGVINNNVEDKGTKVDTMMLIGFVLAFVGFIFPPICMLGFVLVFISAFNQKGSNGMYKTQNGFDVSDNIRYSLYIERTTDKSFVFHDFK